MSSTAKSVLPSLVCILLTVGLSTGCGDFFPSSTAIVAITISPTNAAIQQSAGTEQFSAQGTFGNNTSGDVTGQVNWSSSNGAVATISQAGLATAVGTGSTTITAKSSDTTASTILTVLNVTSMTISGTSSTLAAGAGEQLTAKDQNGNNITSFVTWNSSDTTSLSISSSGFATAGTVLTSTTVNVTATFGSITSSTLSITVE